MGFYGRTDAHLWLVGKIPFRRWEDCKSTSERKRRTHSYDDRVDLLIEPALEKTTTPIWKNASRGTWVKVAAAPQIVVNQEGPKSPLTPKTVEVKGGGGPTCHE